ncbi:MAG: hypothetical protein AAGH15_06460 [Myxococcota bacterium]
MARFALIFAIALVALPAAAQDVPEGAAHGDSSPDGAATEETAPSRAVAPFVGLEWRLLGLGDHVSHGPGFQLGIIIKEHLKLGIAGFGRPGPMNRRTFRVDLPEGETYRGQTSLDLRSDGAVVGLLVAPRMRLPGRASRVTVELPLLVGFGAFGFYLTDDDRRTPDGRRVSEWENELLDERDASGGIALEGGLRVAIDLHEDWLRLTAGVHYTTVVGYDAFVRDDYSGFSGSLGIEVGGR